MNKQSAVDVLLRGSRSLEFFNGQILFRSGNGAGESYKFLSPTAVAAAFQNSPIDSGWIAPGVVRCGGTGRGDFAVLFIPAQRHALPIETANGTGIQTLKVALPSLVFFGRGASFYVWAVKEKTLDPRARLYHAPLPNVFGNGGICWGTNKPPRASAGTITAAYGLFVSSPFNGHAADDKTRSHTRDVRGLLRSLARSRRPFPLRELVELDLGTRNLDDAVNELIGEGGDE